MKNENEKLMTNCSSFKTNLLYMVIRNPPPKPELCGFTTPIHINAATVASTALPPSISISLELS